MKLPSATAQEWTLYDRERFSTGRLRLFQRPIGSEPSVGGEAKLLIDTNLTLPGTLPTQQSFGVRALRVQLLQNDQLLPADAPEWRWTLIEAFIHERRFFSGPAFDVIDPAALIAACSRTNEKIFLQALGAIPRKPFDGLWIHGNTPFVVEITPVRSAPGADIDCRVLLDGVLVESLP